MTTAATVVGHFPLVLAVGPGAGGSQQQHPVMLVAGMILGTALTLFVVPFIYMLVTSEHTRMISPEAAVPGLVEVGV